MKRSIQVILGLSVVLGGAFANVSSAYANECTIEFKFKKTFESVLFGPVKTSDQYPVAADGQFAYKEIDPFYKEGVQTSETDLDKIEYTVTLFPGQTMFRLQRNDHIIAEATIFGEDYTGKKLSLEVMAFDSKITGAKVECLKE